uniref:Phosphatidylcholine transfer protein n=1 Tax=Oncorhynchus tshawytscha TaxID=74940 RepID=A0A8C8M5R3_ONCTS
MSLHFTDEEFLEAWKELDEPQLEGGWEFFTETMGVKIYRLYDKETGLYEYKVFGVLATCTPELCADVYMDLPYRKQWDGYVKELHEKDYDGHSAIYWEVKYPFPLSNRDVSLMRYQVIMFLSKIKIGLVQSGVQRVNDYKQTVAMESDGACGTKVFMNYFDNPGGNIPTWLVNLAAKVSSDLTECLPSCLPYSNYSNYCQKNKK